MSYTITRINDNNDHNECAMGCLSGSSGHLKIHMSVGNNSYSADYNQEAVHSVMDLMERDLGVQFTADEREGNLEFKPPIKRIQKHLMVAPFRIFMEDSAPARDTYDNRASLYNKLIAGGADASGAYMLMHYVYSHAMHGLTLGGRSDQSWFLDCLKYKDSTPFINRVRLPQYLFALYPELYNMTGGFYGTHMNTDGGYSMSIYDMRFRRESLEVRQELSKQMEAIDFSDYFETFIEGNNMRRLKSVDDALVLASKFTDMWITMRDYAHRTIIDRTTVSSVGADVPSEPAPAAQEAVA